MGAEERISLSYFNVASASSVHINLSAFFSNLYSGRGFSPSRLMNRLTVATQPVSRCMSFRHVGRFMFKMALIFYGLTSIPRRETMKPKNLPAGTPKTHFLGLSIMLYFRRLSKVSFKSKIKSFDFLDITAISSSYHGNHGNHSLEQIVRTFIQAQTE